MKLYIFYSNKCDLSSRLIDTIKKENLANNCSFICNETDSNKIPNIVTTYPTILTDNLIKPIIGIDTINWISNMKYFNQNTNNINKLNIIYPQIEETRDLAYNKKEMNSISDNYTDINNNVKIEKCLLEYNIEKEVPILNKSLQLSLIKNKREQFKKR